MTEPVKNGTSAKSQPNIGQECDGIPNSTVQRKPHSAGSGALPQEPLQ